MDLTPDPLNLLDLARESITVLLGDLIVDLL
jgi:hypothetical protein